LRLGVSLAANDDSAELPSRHSNTCRAVRRIIVDLIDNESSTSSFIWLYGPAAARKTAVVLAIVEFLLRSSKTGQKYGGSVFVSRGKVGQDQGHFLFSSIAYQLALKVPGLRQHVNRIMELNPTILTKSMDVQLQTLIVDAFQYLSPLPQHSYLVIVDGLDESYDKATQQLILRLLCQTITVHKLPLRFLIGSRPRDSFDDQESLYTVARRVVLDEMFDPERDIQVFLQDGFAKICAKNSILSHVAQPWPSEDIIDLLLQRSSGQFIYAATVLKFVGADFCSPTEQLAQILKRDLMGFSDLDQLYTQILSFYPSSVNIVQVLGIMIILAFDDDHLTPVVIEDILEMEEGELKLALRGLLSSVDNGKRRCLNERFTGIPPYVIPHFVHASFRDYLLDSSRSGPFHVNRQEYEDQITIRSFALIMQSIRSRR
jgi:hypothetical protein